MWRWATRGPLGTRARPGGGGAVVPRGPILAHLDMRPTPKNSINRETPRNNPRTSTPPPQAYVPSKYHLEPCSGTLMEGEIITGGHLHHPGGLHDEEGIVHLRGWGYVPVAMCLISLSGVLDLAWSWCTASFVNIFGSYGVLPSLPSCDELSLALWGFVMLDWILDLRTLDVCVAYGYPWWQWSIILSHLIYVLVVNLRIPLGT